MRLLFLLFLAACNTPSPQFLGVDPALVDVDGRSFKVYRKGQYVQAIRVGSDFDLSRSNAATRGAIAITRATGCEIRKGSLTTDRILTKARLKKCDDD